MSSATGHTTFYCVYPAPPPTVNSLTSRQKAQLRRSTTKLTKVLGAAPQVIDEHAGSIKVSHPLPLKTMRPTLSVSTGEKNTHRRYKSATERIDPDLYPLSSTLRPVKQSRRHSPGTRSPVASLGSDSFVFPPGLRRTRSRSMSASLRDRKDEKMGSLGDVVPPLSPQARSRPEKEAASRPESFSRDSLCDSLYEPSFIISSSLKLRREKMARVCKLLGEDVPVDLVFPAAIEENHADYDFVLDIRSSSVEPTADDIPPPPPPKSVVVQMPEQPKWTSYHTTALETIVEQSPRSSCSSNFSTNSASSCLTATTSSSYRFTSSGCASAPPSYSSHDSTQSPQITQSINDTGVARRSREFSIYVPSQRRMNGVGCSAEIGKTGAQEFEVVTAMVDLRI
ncbi:hypothetical protein EW145_g7821 [Phellinidium pouzarii]|uniref:Uncharacterized protein n=1 Tax=Phellinidium pouzarii TaxID=167371 RepID=A0A4S4KDP5_9AGAM|nr:hypothetical protein EW145_g7821 [Phellinidium pouzarii]